MFFIISGEGNSDIGKSNEHPGPLVTCLEKLSEFVSDDTFCYDIISESELTARTKEITRDRKMMLLPGSKYKSRNLSHIRRLAHTLGYLAQKQKDAGALLFRDCDFTHSEISNPHEYYQDMVKSIETGFAMADGFKFGVAMVPKMRSETWLLAHYQKTPYMNSDRFEELPANDKAEHSAKAILAQFLNCSIGELYEHITPEDIDWDKIDCSSFLFFKKRFLYVLNSLSHQKAECTEADTLLSSGLDRAKP